MTAFPFRSLLFAPSSRPDVMRKARASEADAVIFDLEDAVAPQDRLTARDNLRNALDGPGDTPAVVRVNHPSTGETLADLDAAVAEHVVAIMLAKAETGDEIRRLDEAISEREDQHGLPAGSIGVIPLIESCLGLHNVYAIATSAHRVASMGFSSGEEGDFFAELEGRWTPSGEALLYPRSKLVCESRAAGLTSPIDGVFMNLADEDALLAECELARTLGFTGKMAIHPKQLPAIHRAFTPSEDEVGRSEKLVEAFAAAQAEGVSAFRHEGKMVDPANVKRAERILARRAAVADTESRR